MKLMLGVPTGGKPTQPFVASLQGLELPPQISHIEHRTVTGNFVPAQRELIVDAALRSAADLLMMADDDMVIPPGAIASLLRPFDDPAVALVGALYYSRDGFRPMAVSGWDPADTTGAAIPAFGESEPVEVDGVGFGLVMIRMSAVATLTRPFFPVQVYIERTQSRVRICNEDYLFCRRLRDERHRVLLHPGVRCGHFDRETGITYPLAWEEPGVTSQRRMMAGKSDGTVGMVPFDDTVPRAHEDHAPGSIDYIYAE